MLRRSMRRLEMPSDERLLAWLTPSGSDFLAFFVAESAAQRRAPATRQFASPDEARQWVMNEAHAIGAPVAWISQDTVAAVAHH
jgi:hypothetical protein